MAYNLEYLFTAERLKWLSEACQALDDIGDDELMHIGDVVVNDRDDKPIGRLTNPDGTGFFFMPGGVND